MGRKPDHIYFHDSNCLKSAVANGRQSLRGDDYGKAARFKGFQLGPSRFIRSSGDMRGITRTGGSSSQIMHRPASLLLTDYCNADARTVLIEDVRVLPLLPKTSLPFEFESSEGLRVAY